MTATTRPFSRAEVAAFLARADAIMADPPAKPWIERHPGRGRLVLRFALPLELCRTEDCGRRHKAFWSLAKTRTSVLAAMAGQLADQAQRAGLPLGWCRDGKAIRPTWPEPLPGRPQVRCVRFSSVAPDAGSGWQKTALDVLLMPRTHAGKPTAALGVLRDDRPAALEVREWWEAAPAGAGGALIEVWTGEES